jgi:hypothetical protein
LRIRIPNIFVLIKIKKLGLIKNKKKYLVIIKNKLTYSSKKKINEFNFIYDALWFGLIALLLGKIK